MFGVTVGLLRDEFATVKGDYWFNQKLKMFGFSFEKVILVQK